MKEFIIGVLMSLGIISGNEVKPIDVKPIEVKEIIIEENVLEETILYENVTNYWE